MNTNDQYKYDSFYAKSLKSISTELFDYISSIDNSVDKNSHLYEIIKRNISIILSNLKNPLNNSTLKEEDIAKIVDLSEIIINNGPSYVVNEITKKLLKTEFGKEHIYYQRVIFPHIIHENNKSWIKMNEHVARDVTDKTQADILIYYYIRNSLEILIALGIVIDKSKYKNDIKIIKSDDSITILSNNLSAKFFIKDGDIVCETNSAHNHLLKYFLMHSPIFDENAYHEYQNAKDGIFNVKLNDYFFKGTSIVQLTEEISLEEIMRNMRLTIATKQGELGKAKALVKSLSDDLKDIHLHLENTLKASQSIKEYKKYLN